MFDEEGNALKRAGYARQDLMGNAECKQNCVYDQNFTG